MNGVKLECRTQLEPRNRAFAFTLKTGLARLISQLLPELYSTQSLLPLLILEPFYRIIVQDKLRSFNLEDDI